MMIEAIEEEVEEDPQTPENYFDPDEAFSMDTMTIDSDAPSFSSEPEVTSVFRPASRINDLSETLNDLKSAHNSLKKEFDFFLLDMIDDLIIAEMMLDKIRFFSKD